MAYSVTCYTRTNCNAVNIPDSPDKLEEFAVTKFSLPALDILQDEGLSEVRVKIVPTGDNKTDYKHIDYIKVGSYYYSVRRRPYKVASDVVLLELTYDGLTTHGGPASLKYLDGLTVRHTTSSDDMFAYTQPDELLGCNEPLKIETEGWSDKVSDGYKVYMESTLNIEAMAHTKEGTTFTDDEGNSVTIPATVHLTSADTSTYFMPDESGKIDETKGVNNGTATILVSTTSAGDTRFSESVLEGAQIARDIGSESAIIAQYAVPLDMCKAEAGDNRICTNVNGVNTTVKTNLPFKWNSDVHNNRVLYGDNCLYGIMTVAGNKAEFKPEDIQHEDDTAPSIRMITDPRPDGAPYFRYNYYLNNKNNFWVNAVKGENWRQVPLIFTEKSGNLIDQYNFLSDQNIRTTDYNYALQNSNRNLKQTGINGIVRATEKGISALAEMGKSFGARGTTKSNYQAGATIPLSKLVDSGLGYANTAFDMGRIGDQKSQLTSDYELLKEKEQNDLDISLSTIAPSVALAPSAGALRDFVGNTFMAYRYHPTVSDAKRLDKILTMYGYKDTVPVTEQIFKNRKNFDYVQAKGVSIGGDIPLWEKADIATQLNAGVRVWHVKPEPHYYTEENPIVKS